VKWGFSGSRRVQLQKVFSLENAQIARREIALLNLNKTAHESDAAKL